MATSSEGRLFRGRSYMTGHRCNIWHRYIVGGCRCPASPHLQLSSLASCPLNCFLGLTMAMQVYAPLNTLSDAFLYSSISSTGRREARNTAIRYTATVFTARQHSLLCIALYQIDSVRPSSVTIRYHVKTTQATIIGSSLCDSARLSALYDQLASLERHCHAQLTHCLPVNLVSSWLTSLYANNPFWFSADIILTIQFDNSLWLYNVCDSARLRALYDQLASLERHAQLTRCLSAVAELLVHIT